MGSRYGSARERALRGLWILLAAGCMAPRFLQDGQMLRHPAGEFAVPDLSDAGWERVGVENADLAFRHPREGTIAVRARCGLSDPLSLEWRSRELYVGVDAERLSQRQIEVNGFPAYEIVARIDEVWIRTIVLWTGSCLVDLALARNEGAAESETFESFVAGFRSAGSP
jgi:hypothetical protein